MRLMVWALRRMSVHQRGDVHHLHDRREREMLVGDLARGRAAQQQQTGPQHLALQFAQMLAELLDKRPVTLEGPFEDRPHLPQGRPNGFVKLRQCRHGTYALTIENS